MKKMILFLVCVLLLSGCAATDTFEQIQDVYVTLANENPKEIKFTLPSDAGMTMLAGENSRMYFCQGYEIALETCTGGDLNRTIKNLTGFTNDDIHLFELVTANGIKRYEFVWTAASEEGETVSRAVVMDDGLYHYCISLTALSEDVGSLQEIWNDFLNTVYV